MRSRRVVVAVGLVGALAAAATGCGSSSPASFRPSLAWSACPSDVSAAFLTPVRCGYLTVLEDRSHPEGRRLKLLLVEVKPPSGRVLPGTATQIKGDLGNIELLDADASAYALRLHRTVVGLEPRGSGAHASPSLRCPEVDRLQTRAVDVPTGDPAFTSSFVHAVSACATRLQGQGVDLAAYGASAQAADLEDLRSALGLSSWAVIGTYGTNDAVLWDYLHASPQRAGAAFADSPSFPAEDPILTQVQDTKSALKALFRLCARQAACAQRHPRLAELWQRALARLDATPLRGWGTLNDGRNVAVLVDAGRLLRTIRFALGGDGPGNVPFVPQMIDAAAHGRLDPHLATLVADDTVLCAGYRAECQVAASFALGTFLSTFCAEQLPLVDASAVQQATAGEPGYDEVFGHDPYVAACRAWPVGQAAAPSSAAVPTPLLLVTGSLDSFSNRAGAERLAAAQPHAWVVEVAGQTHNVLGFSDCAISLRNAWTLHSSSPPHVPPCTKRNEPSLH